MNEMFLKKKGIVTNYLASDLIQLKKGDKLPIVSEYQKKFDVSRGTIQNALNFLKEKQAIVCESRGHLGTFLVDINYTILQEYAVSESVLGTMPLPYSRLYEGFATGLYSSFEQQNIKLNMAYIRGSKERIRSICTETYRFAVVSRFAAQEAINQNEPIRIVSDFGEHTYLSQHILLFADVSKNQIENGMRVGIDYSSYDQQLLTQTLTEGHEIELVEMPGHQLIHGLNQQRIDAGVWNYDEIVDKNYQNMNYKFLETSQIQEDMSAAVIICHKDDQAMQAILKNNLLKEEILLIQKQVTAGEMVPRY
ncbi:GntR family transcriptional regulator YhfZ [Enterococcus sp. BWR-S5]|uniref:GntR family transcriptional regulator YhfZ n=1 Tax=Enterococcus sp. BWR-S5 TaxID=2787714 RepID=UPI001921AEC0|nr:GntR family transcriptional regulator YhfZ [Enterococcus sp. BWR-S5]MBL1226548.1 GntR family transcriptional regulator [Enterococcus sp. BWR-S5]